MTTAQGRERTPEERLRQLLQDEAELLLPSSDALPRLRARIAERRSWGRRLRPLLAATAAVGVVVAGSLVTTTADRPDARAEQVAPEPAPVETEEPEECAAGGDVLCTVDEPPPAVPVTSGVTTSAPGVPFWPFVDDREAASWVRDPGARAWAGDPQQVAQHLVDDLLRLRGIDAGPVQGTSVLLRRGTAPVGTVRLVQVGRGAGMPWSVVGVAAPALEVSDPAPGQRVDSPLAVTVTGAVPPRVALLSSTGVTLASGGGGSPEAGGDRSAASAPAGDASTSVSLDWSDLTWSVAAVVVTSGDPVTGLAVVPVRRSGAAGPGIPPAASTFVAIDRGVVVLHDGRSGQRLRQLSYPPEGAVDGEPSRGGDGAVFVRRRADPCDDELVRVSLGTGAAGVTGPRRGASRRSPALSPDGRLLAWVERRCRRGSAEEVVLRGPDARERRLSLLSERTDLSGLDHLAVRDDGALLFTLPSGGVASLAAGATTVDAATRLGSGDCPDTAPAWSGRDVWLWRGCAGGSVGLLLAAPDYGSGLRPPTMPVSSVRTTSVAQTSSGPQALVQLGDARALGPVARVVDGRLVELFANQGCATTEGSCLSDPTW